jgi:hypothetical protein
MKYKYRVSASRYGGEHVIGTIPKTIADYWLKRTRKANEDVFEEYMMAWDRDESNKEFKVPKKYQLPEWYECDDIEHLTAGEFALGNVFYVDDANEEITGMGSLPLLHEIEMKDNLINKKINPFTLDDKWKNPEKEVVFGQSFEKGNWTYEVIETDKPFDVSKFKCNVTYFEDIMLIHSIEYDGKEYCNEGGDSIGKSQGFWIADKDEVQDFIDVQKVS